MEVSPQGILAAQTFIDDLQAAAFKYQSDSGAEAKLLLHIIMQELAMLKTLVTQALLKHASDSQALAPLQKALDLWQKLPGVQALFIKGIIHAKGCASNTRRSHLMQAEEEAVAALHSDKWPLAQPELLKQVLQQLHVVQQDMTFHAEMNVGIQVAARTSRWSVDNFAYGSTPYHGWLSIFEHPAVRDYVAAAVASTKHFQVWGSSIGWLVFYAALTYGLEAVGYELLRCHVDIAQGLATDLQVPQVSFNAQDMLQSDLDHTAVLMLASFCWDRQLHIQAVDKIQAELLHGSIVVDYTAALGKCLKLIATVQIPVSWNSQQNMYVYLKE